MPPFFKVGSILVASIQMFKIIITELYSYCHFDKDTKTALLK